MNEIIQVLPLFPESIGITKLKINNNNVLNFLEKIKYDTRERLNGKYSKTSYMSLSNKLFDNKELKELKIQCENGINLYLKKILEFDISFKICNSWGTKTMPEGYSHIHNHTHSLISAVYYPKHSKNFKIKFHKNSSLDTFWDIEPKVHNKYNCKSWEVTPLESELWIFPSTLLHSIEINKSNEIRYSIAFSVNPVGVFGSGDNEIEFK